MSIATLFNRPVLFALSVGLVFSTGCVEVDAPAPDTHASTLADYDEYTYQDGRLTDSVLYDKILGCLVGSAIGDAMGAPTEMWQQTDIDDEYGHVDSLTLVLREPSPEGPWSYNLPPGAGTDDTRWKDLMVDYLVQEHNYRTGNRPLVCSVGRFSTFINTRYANHVEELKETSGLEPEPLEDAMRRVTWLQEWARLTRAYSANDVDAYRNALSRFYGGEMSCAGMLYAPVVGAAFPGRPGPAYQAAYDLGLFDLGYARDITGLTAALTAAAFAPDATPETFVQVMRETDPEGFFRSRLIGRVAYQQFKQARAIVRVANRTTPEEVRKMKLRIPVGYLHDSLTYGRKMKAYELLDEAKQDVPFHAGEINLVNLTALLFSNYQFDPAMEFVINYGRDNDTVAAITGSILGALRGFHALPREARETVLRVNREVLEIDLEARASDLTEAVLSRRPPQD